MSHDLVLSRGGEAPSTDDFWRYLQERRRQRLAAREELAAAKPGAKAKAKVPPSRPDAQLSARKKPRVEGCPVEKAPAAVPAKSTGELGQTAPAAAAPTSAAAQAKQKTGRQAAELKGDTVPVVRKRNMDNMSCTLSASIDEARVSAEPSGASPVQACRNIEAPVSKPSPVAQFAVQSSAGAVEPSGSRSQDVSAGAAGKGESVAANAASARSRAEAQKSAGKGRPAGGSVGAKGGPAAKGPNRYAPAKRQSSQEIAVQETLRELATLGELLG